MSAINYGKPVKVEELLKPITKGGIFGPVENLVSPQPVGQCSICGGVQPWKPTDLHYPCSCKGGGVFNPIESPPRPTDELTHTRSCPALTPGHNDDCTCGLEWRIALQTEQTMHTAWRKRAEAAEREIDALRVRSQPAPCWKERRDETE